MCTEFNINYIYRRMNFSSWYCSLVPWPSHNAPQTFAEHCGKARVIRRTSDDSVTFIMRYESADVNRVGQSARPRAQATGTGEIPRTRLQNIHSFIGKFIDKSMYMVYFRNKNSIHDLHKATTFGSTDFNEFGCILIIFLECSVSIFFAHDTLCLPLSGKNQVRILKPNSSRSPEVYP